MEALDKAISALKNFEGLRLKAYKDGGGVWTVGYGSTGPGITEHTEWSLEKAEHDLRIRTESIISVIRKHVKVPLNDNQLAALVSLGYNIGISALFGSTLFKKLNERKYEEAAGQFERWCYIKKVPSKGLLNRRQKEKALFLS